MKKILLIQTGGTIAMQAQLDGVVLDPDRWSDQLYKQIPTLNEIADIDVHPLFSKIVPIYILIIGIH